MVVESIHESIDIPPFLETYWHQYPDEYPTPIVLQAIERSVAVRNITVTVNTKSITYFNIYMGSPTWDADGLESWIGLIRGIPYSSIFGIAKIQPVFNCWLCKATDHPTGKCPYKELPGWHDDDGAPRPHDNTPRDAEGSGGKNGRGLPRASRGQGAPGRGRGNGRGVTSRGRL